MIPLGGYAGGGNLELGAAIAGILCGVGSVVFWAACVVLGYWVGGMAGDPATGAVIAGFGIPIFVILVNGWIGMWQDARREETK